VLYDTNEALENNYSVMLSIVVNHMLFNFYNAI